MMLDPLQPDYDVLIIGAGPAGLLAANTLVDAKAQSRVGAGPLRIGLLDKRDPWREPVACAEAVHAAGLKRLVPNMEADWVREPVDGVIFVSPDGTRVAFDSPGSGYLIDRARMHKRLAEWAQAKGVHCHFRSRVTAVSEFRDGMRIVTVDGQNPLSIKARVIIDASGPGAGFGKGEPLVQGDLDVEPAVFALIRGPKYPVNYIQLFFGRNYAPGGYAWLFPRDAQVANVGLVVGKAFAKEFSARKLLQEFIAKEYPGAEIECFHGGAIPCGWNAAPLAHENLIKAGDAANMVHPLSRAGILEAMLGGKLAAETAISILDKTSEEEKRPFYQLYQKVWEKAYGSNHGRVHRAKAAFNAISDQTYDKAAHALAKVPKDKVSMGRIVFTTLWHSPSLVWRLRSLFWN
jgi:digeranylgeranylglycerophospholipid reductase